MYVIIVYDVSVKRVVKINKYLKQYLNWIQNSVFEGELTESQYKILSGTIKKIINEKEDTVIIYKIVTKKTVDRILLGIEKGKDDRFI